MRILVVYFSYQGNNRLLASYLAKNLKADLCPVVETKRRNALTTMLDMAFKRNPKVKSLRKRPEDYEHVVLLSPLWDATLANPMRSMVRKEARHLREYSFISFSGYRRPMQPKAVEQELFDLIGHPPVVLQEIHVSDLLPEEDRHNLRLISGYRAKPEDLEEFKAQLKSFVEDVTFAYAHV